MATQATTSTGTIIKIKNAAAAWVKIAEFKEFSGVFSGSAAIADATHFDSTSREKLTGVTDEGSYKLTFNYIATDAGQLLLFDKRNTSALGAFQLILSGGQTLAVSGYVLSAEVTGGVDKPYELNVTLEVSGGVAIS